MSNLFSYVVPLIIMLGVLIFVHELGHFLVAKYFKVRVEVFSLGFGKKLVSFRRGDTEYCISAVPLGGYVKMFGDDPSAEISEADRAASFLHKPVGQRIAVVLAGPLMNLFFAFVLYTAISMIGEKAIFPGLGDIEPTSAAATAGFKSGDTLLSVNEPNGVSHKFSTWNEVDKVIQTNPDSKLDFNVQRANGNVETVSVVPKLVPNPNVLALKKEVGGVEGLSFISRASTIAVGSLAGAAGRAGLRTGDTITKINSTQLHRWRELLIAAGTFADQSEITVTVQRGLLESFLNEGHEPKTLEFKLKVPASAKGKTGLEALKAMGFDDPELYLASVEKSSPAMKAGLLPGDLLTSIDGTPVTKFEEVMTKIRTFKGETSMHFTVIRNEKPVEIDVIPNVKKRMNGNGQEESRFEVGIRPMIIDDNVQTVDLTTRNILEAMERGVVRSGETSAMVVMGLVRLIQGEVSSKNVGGFLSIGQMAKSSWGRGAADFLFSMAMISINLFILNLLPVPVLDGGHLIFYSIEAVRGAPLSMQKMEFAQRIGAALLVGLMVFALFNDVSRIWFK
jgi:regulator of sigma E protease